MASKLKQIGANLLFLAFVLFCIGVVSLLNDVLDPVTGPILDAVPEAYFLNLIAAYAWFMLLLGMVFAGFFYPVVRLTQRLTNERNR